MSSAASPLQTRRARIRQIRARVAIGAAAAFVGVFGFLFGQLWSGSDPGLNDSASTTTTTSQNTAADDSSSSDQTWSSSSSTPVQTGQS